MDQPTATAKPATVDAYVATFPPDVRAVLNAIRATIRAAAPDAEETVSYGIGAFRLRGRPLVYVAGFQRHTSIFPAPLQHPAFREALAPYASGKATAKFPLGEPVPHDLIRAVTQHRVEEALHVLDAKGKRR